VVSSARVVGPKPKRNFEVIARLIDSAGARKNIGQVAVRVGEIGLNPDRLAKGRLSRSLLPTSESDHAKIVVGLGHFRIDRRSLIERRDRIQPPALLSISLTQFMPRDGIIGFQRPSSIQDLYSFRILSRPSQRPSKFLQPGHKFRTPP